MRSLHVLLILFLWMIVGGTFAEAQRFEAGLRIGMAATQVGGDQLEGFDKAGLLGGLFVARDLSERTSLSMEMLYIQKGSRKPVDKDDNSYYRLRLNYLEVPLMVRYKAGKKFVLEAGPSFGVLVFAQEDDQLGVIEYAPPFNDWELAGNAGLQYLLNEKWNVDVRYSVSVLPVRPFRSSYYYSYWDRGQFNEVVQLSFNYSF